MNALLLAAALGAAPVTAPAAVSTTTLDPQVLYTANCQVCHGEARLGLVGPALLPENLDRLPKNKAVATIREGRPATQMPPFQDKLAPAQIDALAAYLYTPPAVPVKWDLPEIRASHLALANPATLSTKPVYKADRWNLFVVVETGDHHVTILDGDKFEPITRFQSRYALHGGPKFTKDGRYVFFASRDGWISKFDLFNLVVVAEVRAGINTRNLAVSDDGKFVLVGNYLPRTVVMLSAETLLPIKVFAAASTAGTSSRVSAVYAAPPRQSFIVALKDAKELWEIRYAPPKGAWVHDYNRESGDMLAVTTGFNIRRIPSDDFIDDFFFSPDYRYVFASDRDQAAGHVIDLDTGKKVTDVTMPGMPHLGSGITWKRQGHTVMATQNLKKGLVSVVNLDDWKTVGEIPLPGPGFFLRSHERTPYAWADGMMGATKDTLQLIDKQTLAVAKTVTPAPGKTAAHVEFTKDGRYALVSVWEMDGELVVYDAKTLAVVKRLPMKKPSGKYNVWNKTHLEEGTSH
jgi:mono/diheme cytochrome c family protein/DNA-binding beta-propeller fold protein YncE